MRETKPPWKWAPRRTVSPRNSTRRYAKWKRAWRNSPAKSHAGFCKPRRVPEVPRERLDDERPPFANTRDFAFGFAPRRAERAGRRRGRQHRDRTRERPFQVD